MFIEIPDLLTAAQTKQLRDIAAAANFVDGRITIEELDEQICELRISCLKSSKELVNNLEKTVLTNFESDSITINDNQKSRGLSDLLQDLSFELDLYDPNVSYEENLNFPDKIVFGMSKEFFRLNVKEFFLPKMNEASLFQSLRNNLGEQLKEKERKGKKKKNP